MDLGLAGRNVLITGGSGDLGSALARGFAAEGARIAITYASQQSVADSLCAELMSAGAVAAACPMDLTDLDSVRQAVACSVESLGGLDVVISNAVVWEDWRSRIEEWGPCDWQRVLRANTEGVFTLIQEAAPHLRASDGGRVVFISSSLTARGMAGIWCYTTAKTAGHGLARSLAWDLGRDGVLVNTVAPGIVLRPDGHHRNIPDEEIDKLAQAQPLGRLPTVDDVVHAVLFLGSRANGIVNAEIVQATGGIP